MNNIRANLFHLMVIRWITLANVLFGYYFGVPSSSYFILCIVITYCLLVTIFWKDLTEYIRKYPIFTQLDIIFTGLLIAFTGGSWASPYYLYGFTSLILVAYFLDIRGTLISTSFLVLLYVFGFYTNQSTYQQLMKNGDLDIFITSCMGLFLVSTSFGFPAQTLREIMRAYNDAKAAEDYLISTKVIISGITFPESLTCRELQILLHLSEGKTNKEIAQILFLTDKTIRNHLYNIYKKIGVKSRSEAILYYKQHSLI